MHCIIHAVYPLFTLNSKEISTSLPNIWHFILLKKSRFCAYYLYSSVIILFVVSSILGYSYLFPNFYEITFTGNCVRVK